MTVAQRSYPAWKAPADDGQVMVWPEIPQLIASVQPCVPPALQGAHAEIRRDMRAFLGLAGDAPVIAAGHQIELHHPGVWVKNVLIDTLARRTGGQAVHFAVDTDEPKHLSLRWPGGSVPITDDPALSTAAWSGLVELPTPAHLRLVRSELEAAGRQWNFEPMIGAFLDSMQRLLLESPSLVNAVANATHELEWNLGLRHHVMIASPMWQSRPYMAFVHDIIANLGQFARDYNDSLAEYRKAAGIKSPGRPMPDLKLSGDVAEAPFWCDDMASGARQRASVRLMQDQWTLEAGGDRFTFDPTRNPLETADDLLAFLRHRHLQLSPRAITLTMFVRVFVADLFIHGIGGGQYDQVTDRLIERRYRIAPPPFGVATATLYFPAAAGRARTCVSCIEQEGHRLRHNLLGEAKREMVRQIESLPRGSRERRQAFYEMHRRLDSAALNSPVMRDWQERLHAAQSTEREEAALFDRELFFALQPRQRLEHIINRLNEG